MNHFHFYIIVSTGSAICEPTAEDYVSFERPPEAPAEMTPSDFDLLYEDQSEPTDSNANYR